MASLGCARHNESIVRSAVFRYFAALIPTAAVIKDNVQVKPARAATSYRWYASAAIATSELTIHSQRAIATSAVTLFRASPIKMPTFSIQLRPCTSVACASSLVFRILTRITARKRLQSTQYSRSECDQLYDLQIFAGCGQASLREICAPTCYHVLRRNVCGGYVWQH